MEPFPRGQFRYFLSEPFEYFCLCLFLSLFLSFLFFSSYFLLIFLFFSILFYSFLFFSILFCSAVLCSAVQKRIDREMPFYRAAFVRIVCFQIHDDDEGVTMSGCCAPWKALVEAFKVFHPRSWNEPKTTDLQWSGIRQVDFLISQQLAVAATLWFMEHCSKHQDWPWFVSEAGRGVCSDANLLRGWNISSWIEEGSLLPWKRILPTCFLNLLPYVLLHVLLYWSEIFMIQQEQEQGQEQDRLLVPHLFSRSASVFPTAFG